MNARNLSYTVTESIHRRNGRITKLVYKYEENQEEYELDLLTQRADPISKYRAIIKRSEYERLIDACTSDKNKLSFENFVRTLRPIMMGTYAGNELQDAFSLLDKHRLNTVDIDELSEFLSIIYSTITKEILSNYLDEMGINVDQKLDFEQFSDLVLRGIGRHLICGYI